MTITSPHEIPRDHYGRPLVIPPDGGKPTAYTRCTTFVGCLEDTYNLSRWQQRMVAIGLAESPDLMLQIASTDRDDKKALDGVTETALDRARAGAGATIGTALHALTEQIDRGIEVSIVPEAYRADLDAYREATEPLTAVHIEQFSVLDSLKIGGTPDRVVEVGGQLFIADLKTGSVDYGMGKIAMQLAVYAHSIGYDHATGQRFALGDGREINTERAIVIHLPAGSGSARLLDVDIAAGWDAVQLANEVRAWRRRKDLAAAWTPPDAWSVGPSFPVERVGDPANVTVWVEPASPAPVNDGSEPGWTISDYIAHAESVVELNALWAEHAAAWTPNHTALAAARKALLEQGAVSTNYSARFKKPYKGTR